MRKERYVVLERRILNIKILITTKNKHYMKVLHFFLIGLLITLASCGASKESSTKTGMEINRDRRTVLASELKRKALKTAQKEAKNYKKEGYRVFLGDMPMDKQIENAWMKAIDLNDKGYPENIVGHAQVTAGNSTAAKSQALHAAKVEIASLTSSMIAALIESSVGNNEITTVEAQTLNKHLQASKELIVADLGQVLKVLEIYRELPNKNVLVITRVAYNSSLALEAAGRRLRKEMEAETQALHQKLDNVFNLERVQMGSNTNVEMD